MTLRVLILIAALAAVECGQLSVLFTSPSVQFKTTNDVLPESHVTSVLQSAFGIQPENELEWRGLLAGSFFDRPRALLLLSVSGVSAEQFNVTSSQLYDTLEDEREPLSLHTLVEGLEDLSRDEKPVLFIDLYVDKRHRVHVGAEVLGRVENVQLPVSTPRYLVELHAIRQIVNKVADNFASLQERVSSPHIYHFHVAGLEHVLDRHGAQSPQMSKAVTSVHETLTQTVATLRAIYADDITALFLCQSISRQLQQKPYQSTSVARRRLQETTPNTELIADLNLAPEFTWMYPVMFNISLWFMVTFSIIMFGVSWCIWFTDPGRDGVIYRMTTHHLKEA